MSQIAQCFSSLRPQSHARLESQAALSRVPRIAVTHLSVRLLSDSDAEPHVLEALHGAQIRAEDHSQAKRVAGVALIAAGRAHDEGSQSQEKRTAIRSLWPSWRHAGGA